MDSEPLTLVVATEGARLAEAVQALSARLPHTQAAIKRQIEASVRTGQLQRSHGDLLQVYLDSVLGSSLAVLRAEISLHQHSTGLALLSTLQRPLLRVKSCAVQLLRRTGSSHKQRLTVCTRLQHLAHTAQTRLQTAAFRSLQQTSLILNRKHTQLRSTFRSLELLLRRNRSETQHRGFARWHSRAHRQVRPLFLFRSLDKAVKTRLAPLFTQHRLRSQLIGKRNEKMKHVLRENTSKTKNALSFILQKWKFSEKKRYDAVDKLIKLATFRPKSVLTVWKMQIIRSDERDKLRKAVKVTAVLTKILRNSLHAAGKLRSKAVAAQSKLLSSVRNWELSVYRRVLDRLQVRPCLRSLSRLGLRDSKEAWKRWQLSVTSTRYVQPLRGSLIASLLQKGSVRVLRSAFQTILRSEAKTLRSFVTIGQSLFRRYLSKWRFASNKVVADKAESELKGLKATQHLTRASRARLQSPLPRSKDPCRVLDMKLHRAVLRSLRDIWVLVTRKPAQVDTWLRFDTCLKQLGRRELRYSWGKMTSKRVRIGHVLSKLDGKVRAVLQKWKGSLRGRNTAVKGTRLTLALSKPSYRVLRLVTHRLVRPQKKPLFLPLLHYWQLRQYSALSTWKLTVTHSQRFLLFSRAVALRKALLPLSGRYFQVVMKRRERLRAGSRHLLWMGLKRLSRAFGQWRKRTGCSVSAERVRRGGKAQRGLIAAFRRTVRHALERLVKRRDKAVTRLVQVLERLAQEPKCAVSRWRHLTFSQRGERLRSLQQELRGSQLQVYLSPLVRRVLRLSLHLVLGTFWTTLLKHIAKRPKETMHHWLTLAHPSANHINHTSSPSFAAKRLNQVLHHLPKRVVRTVFGQVVAGDRRVKVRIAEFLRIMKEAPKQAFEVWKEKTRRTVALRWHKEVQGQQLRSLLSRLSGRVCRSALQPLLSPSARVRAALRSFVRLARSSEKVVLRTWQRHSASVHSDCLNTKAAIQRIQALMNHIGIRSLNFAFKSVTFKPGKLKNALKLAVNALLAREKHSFAVWKQQAKGRLAEKWRGCVLQRSLLKRTEKSLAEVFRRLRAPHESPALSALLTLARLAAQRPRFVLRKWAVRSPAPSNSLRFRDLLAAVTKNHVFTTFKLLKTDKTRAIRRLIPLIKLNLKTVFSLWSTQKPRKNGSKFQFQLHRLVQSRKRMAVACLKKPQLFPHLLHNLERIKRTAAGQALRKWRERGVSETKKLVSLQKVLTTSVSLVNQRLRRVLRGWREPGRAREKNGTQLQRNLTKLPLRQLRWGWDHLFGSPSLFISSFHGLNMLLKSAQLTSFHRWRSLLRGAVYQKQYRKGQLLALKLKSASARRLGMVLEIVLVQSKSTWILLQHVLRWRAQAPEVKGRGLQGLFLRALTRTLLSVLGRINRLARTSQRTPSRQRVRNDQLIQSVLSKLKFATVRKLQSAVAALYQRQQKFRLIRKLLGVLKTAALVRPGERVSVRQCFGSWKWTAHRESVRVRALKRLVFWSSASYQSAFWKWKLLLHPPNPASRLRVKAQAVQSSAAKQLYVQVRSVYLCRLTAGFTLMQRG